MLLNVNLKDEHGNIITPPKCGCGNNSTTFITGTEAYVWMCNDCLYGKDYKAAPMVLKRTRTAKLRYKQSKLEQESWNVDLRA